MACLAPSSSGLGRRPLKPKTGVRLPLGLLHRKVRKRRRSSMAEQGTHKPLVPSSNLGVATNSLYPRLTGKSFGTQYHLPTACPPPCWCSFSRLAGR